MSDFEVKLEPDKIWALAGKPEGIPNCVLCGVPLLMIGGSNEAYGFCLNCREYYVARDRSPG